jgi:hypothetical protein
MTIQQGRRYAQGFETAGAIDGHRCIALASASAAGAWKHEMDQNDGDLLTYSENGDVSAFWAAPILKVCTVPPR